MSTDSNVSSVKKVVVPWYAYVSLALTILFLSGIFSGVEGPLRALDFNNILGEFGSLGTLEKGGGALASNFKGIGGTGAKEGFLLALTVAPAIILAFGVVEMCTDFKGLLAAEKIFTPIIKPILGLPGAAVLAIITSFTSSDAGAGMIKTLHSDKYINGNQQLILTVMQFSAPSILINFFAIGAILMPFIDRSVTIALLVIIIMKFVGAILFRVYLSFVTKRGKEV